MPSEMVRWTIQESADAIRSKQISPVELAEAYIDAVKRIDPQLGAFITVTEDPAMEQARAAEKEILGGTYRGPLHGIPVALKDIIDTAGVRTTVGSKILRDNIPSTDAQVWRRLRDAGCVLLGKTNMHEFARGSTTDNPHYGRCRNPWSPDGMRIPGGSSGGSGAAVAACLCGGALGTDTMGSVRKPAARCGIVGIKPTYDLVSCKGVFPLAWSLDHVGPMTRTVTDAALMLRYMVDTTANPEFLPETLLPSGGGGIKGIKLGLIRGWWDARCDDEVKAAFEQALKVYASLGSQIVEIDFPLMSQLFAVGRVVSICEAAAVHRAWLQERMDEYGTDVRNALLVGMTISANDYLHCVRVRGWAIGQINALFSQADVIVSPCTKDPAPTYEEARGPEGLDIPFYSGPAAFLGMPAISVPCGFSGGEIPIGFQIMGPHFRDDLIINIARAYEAATGWHLKRPPICA